GVRIGVRALTTPNQIGCCQGAVVEASRGRRGRGSSALHNALEAYQHQELPFELLVQGLVPVRAFDRNPLFDVMFSFVDGASAVEWPAHLQVEVSEVETPAAKFDLLLSLQEAEAGLTGVIEFSTKVFDRASAKRMAGHMEVLVEDIARRPRGNIFETP